MEEEDAMGAQPPLGPEELSAPPLSGDNFLALLDEQFQAKCAAPPPFLQALYDGQLTQEHLQLWVKDQYPYWDEGLVYSTGAIFIKTNDEPTRTHMLRRIVDIEGEDVVGDLSGSDTPSWEELWLRFGTGAGLSPGEALDWKPFTRTYFAIQTLRTYSRYWDWTWLDGVASFYASDLYGRAFLDRAYQALPRPLPPAGRSPWSSSASTWATSIRTSPGSGRHSPTGAARRSARSWQPAPSASAWTSSSSFSLAWSRPVCAGSPPSKSRRLSVACPISPLPAQPGGASAFCSYD